MKLPLPFRRDRPIIPSANAQDHAERLIAESLRMLGQVCSKVADAIEAQRLERQGYAHNSYLRRLDKDEDDDAKKPSGPGTGG
ncbi:hypothetical protein HPP05_39885 [Corallococcus exiguus]|uniref:hypothetical protein n=1 Tax=Corallococcus exiguus TaxID=83462 RepID=UPI0014948043|nr:hypothetical protein [Corallococcus exiguus]NPC75918.1 hypothetical protein [Corallococcus exiguus]